MENLRIDQRIRKSKNQMTKGLEDQRFKGSKINWRIICSTKDMD